MKDIRDGTSKTLLAGERSHTLGEHRMAAGTMWAVGDMPKQPAPRGARDPDV